MLGSLYRIKAQWMMAIDSALCGGRSGFTCLTKNLCEFF